jgi:putative tricarboxylic transport membrane protein
LSQLEAEVAHELEERRPPAGGPIYQVVSSLVPLALGLTGAVLAYGYGLGTLKRPGAGLWPFVISMLIVTLSLLLLVIGRHLQDAEKFTRSSLLVIIGLATFVGIAVLLPIIGFEIPSLLLCVVWLKFLGGESWRSTVIVSVVTVAAFYLLFLYGLRIPLPHLF